MLVGLREGPAEDAGAGENDLADDAMGLGELVDDANGYSEDIHTMMEERSVQSSARFDCAEAKKKERRSAGGQRDQECSSETEKSN